MTTTVEDSWLLSQMFAHALGEQKLAGSGVAPWLKLYDYCITRPESERCRAALSYMYRNGLGVPQAKKDDKRADQELREAALRRHGPSAMTLASANSLPHAERLLWLQMAAAMEPEAMYKLGKCYLYGNLGLSKHEEMAMQCFKQCGETHLKAQRRIGIQMMLNKDLEGAYRVLKQAADKGDALACYHLYVLLKEPSLQASDHDKSMLFYFDPLCLQ